jgi:hypothetical protein
LKLGYDWDAIISPKVYSDFDDIFPLIEEYNFEIRIGIWKKYTYSLIADCW